MPAHEAVVPGTGDIPRNSAATAGTRVPVGQDRAGPVLSIFFRRVGMVGRGRFDTAAVGDRGVVVMDMLLGDDLGAHRLLHGSAHSNHVTLRL